MQSWAQREAYFTLPKVTYLLGPANSDPRKLRRSKRAYAAIPIKGPFAPKFRSEPDVNFRVFNITNKNKHRQNQIDGAR